MIAETRSATRSTRIAFIDRDGTLIEEPADEQIDRVDQIRFMPGVFAGLSDLIRQGYRLVMVTNQDGLGTETYTQAAFDEVQAFILEAFTSQGIFFDAVLVCPHRLEEGCRCRKPGTALIEDYVSGHKLDLSGSVVIGDRDTDLALAAHLALPGVRVRRHGSVQETWPHAVRTLLARRAKSTRRTRETCIEVEVNLDATGPTSISTGIGFLDHLLEQLAHHGGFAMILTCAGDLHVDEHHTVEDCALAVGEALRAALGAKVGIARYGFLLPMDESEAKISLDLAGRAYARFTGRFSREFVGALPTELVPHFFRSLSDALRAAIHVEVHGENTHHMIEACFKGVGRALRQAIHRENSTLPSTKGLL